MGGDVLGRHNRVQQVGGLRNPGIGFLQAVLQLKRGGESFCIRQIDGAQLSEKTLLILLPVRSYNSVG